MLSYVLRRVAQAVIVLLAVGLVAFSIFQFLGDPIDALLSVERTPEAEARARAELGLDQPPYTQYALFLARAARGEFGLSYEQNRPVTEVIGEALPATLELAAVSGVFAFVVGITLGVFTAIGRRAAASQIVMAISLIGVSLPTFLIGILLIYTFSVGFEIELFGRTFDTGIGLPSFGRGETVEIGGWTSGLATPEGRQAIILPAITLGLYQMTLIMRLVRSEMLEVLRQDYIRFARARGLGPRVVHFRHALKNTLVPVITVAGLQLGAIIAFATVTETVFNWRGVGFLFIEAVRNVDIPMLSAYLMMIAVIFVNINLIVDLLYLVIDPRLRTGR